MPAVEELQALISAADAVKLVEALSPLTEGDRAKLAREANRLYREMQARLDSPTWEPGDRDDLRAANARRSCARLAVVALCTWSVIKRIDFSGWKICHTRDGHELLGRVIRDRKPAWIDDLMRYLVEHEPTLWSVARGLVRTHAFVGPPSDAYIDAMIRCRAGASLGTSLTDHLLADAGMLDDEIWRLFENAATRDSWYMYDRQMEPSNSSWYHTLVHLGRVGRVDRLRLLQASLDGLAHGPRPGNAGWFYDLHEALEPTVDERARMQSSYAELLASRHSATVRFALHGFSALAGARRLCARTLLAHVAPVFTLPTKGQALQALGLLRRVLLDEPTCEQAVAEAAVAALGHDSVAVQEKALDVLEQMPSACVRSMAEAMVAQRHGIQPSLRTRFAALVDVQEPDVTTGCEAPSSEALRIRLAALPSDVRTLAGLDAFEDMLARPGYLPPVTFDARAVPRLSAATRLARIDDVDEMIERLSTAVECLHDSDEFELLVDGISRLDGATLPSFATAVAPLLKRTHDHAFRMGVLTYVVFSWADPPSLPEYPKNWNVRSCTWQRLFEVGRRIRDGVRLPTLACPTHRLGWVEPSVLVERVLAYQARQVIPGRHDLIQALLRAAPDGRPAALTSARTIEGPVGKLLRYALGGDDYVASPKVGTGMLRSIYDACTELFTGGGTSDSDPALQTAAARCRTPGGPIEAPPGWSIPVDWPYAGAEVTFEWSVQGAVTQSLKSKTKRILQVSASPYPPEQSLQAAYPLAVRLYWMRNSIVHSADDGVLRIRQDASTWPVDGDAVFAHGAVMVSERLDARASPYEWTHAYLDKLLDRDQPLTDMARLLLLVSLSAMDGDVRNVAIDAFIDAVDDGRITGSSFGGMLAELLPTELLRLNRLAEAFDAVARTSTLHTFVCGATVQTALLGSEAVPRDLHFLLERLCEWLVRCGAPLDPTLQSRFAAIKGKSKTSSMARKLGTLQAPMASECWRNIAAQAIDGRCRRAERWMESR